MAECPPTLSWAPSTGRVRVLVWLRPAPAAEHGGAARSFDVKSFRDASERYQVTEVMLHHFEHVCACRLTQATRLALILTRLRLTRPFGTIPDFGRA